jgi:hypothetical protein
MTVSHEILFMTPMKSNHHLEILPVLVFASNKHNGGSIPNRACPQRRSLPSSSDLSDKGEKSWLTIPSELIRVSYLTYILQRATVLEVTKALLKWIELNGTINTSGDSVKKDSKVDSNWAKVVQVI